MARNDWNSISTLPTQDDYYLIKRKSSNQAELALFFRGQFFIHKRFLGIWDAVVDDVELWACVPTFEE